MISSLRQLGGEEGGCWRRRIPCRDRHVSGAVDPAAAGARRGRLRGAVGERLGDGGGGSKLGESQRLRQGLGDLDSTLDDRLGARAAAASHGPGSAQGELRDTRVKQLVCHVGVEQHHERGEAQRGAAGRSRGSSSPGELTKSKTMENHA